jgi:hypothetical protein
MTMMMTTRKTTRTRKTLVREATRTSSGGLTSPSSKAIRNFRMTRLEMMIGMIRYMMMTVNTDTLRKMTTNSRSTALGV